MKTEPIKKVPPFTPTRQQREWLEKEKEETGNSFASILKGLMQEKIDKGGRWTR